MHIAGDEDSLSKRATSTTQLLNNPYDIRAYLDRARYHERLGYPDLAAGDAYKALLLIDEVEDGGYHEQVRNYLLSTKSKYQASIGVSSAEQIALMAKEIELEAYILLTKALQQCGDLHSALDFVKRGVMVCPGERSLQTLLDALNTALAPCSKPNVNTTQIEADLRAIYGVKRKGLVRREIYPWNKHEPDRCSEESVAFLNTELKRCAPKCEIRVTELPVLFNPLDHQSGRDEQVGLSSSTVRQLGIFAIQDIDPHEKVLSEPSILAVNNRLLDSCSDIYFCSQTCHDRAQELYHPAVCGIEDFDTIAKEPSRGAATDALYLLLVVRVIAMAETQDTHPLDLPQVKYLWGDFSSSNMSVERKASFDFQTNVVYPIQILVNIGINPFSPNAFERYDIWVLNILFAKFGAVASAKMNERTMCADVAGVHPLWCLANHSCAPNVRWNWAPRNTEPGNPQGFVARGDDEVVQWGQNKRVGGIKKGEEILNHYCALDLTVKERREWAAGALGGTCNCERCLWEDTIQQEK